MGPQPTFTGIKHISSREQLISELKNSNKLLSSIVEFYPDATLIIDNDGRVIAWNKAIEEMTGVKEKDMLGRGNYEYAIPFYRHRKPLLLNLLDMPPEKIDDRYRDVRVRNGKLDALAVKAKIKGEDAVIWVNACKLYDADGRVVGAIESIRDVTGQKKAEDARRESEQRLADIIGFLPDATFAIGKDGKVVAWNRAIEEMTGVHAGDMLGKGDYEYSMPFYGKRRPILIDLVFRADEAFSEIYSYIEKKGDALLAEIEMPTEAGLRILWGKAVPFYDNDGNIVGAIESIRDITDRKQVLEELKRHRDHLEELIAVRTADLREVNEVLQQEIAGHKRSEEALRRNENFLMNLFESIQDGISVLDRSLNIVRVNKTMERWHPDMLPLGGKKCYYAYHGRSEPCENCPSITAISEAKAQVKTVRRDGPVAGWQEVYCFPLFDNSGYVVGVIDYIRDVTERKQSEEELQEATAQAELYLDIISHDINNMNQVGIGFLELALDTLDLNEKDRSLIAKPLGALEGSSRLIDNVRKLQKIKSGELRHKEMDVGRVLKEVQAHYSQMPGRSVTINFSFVNGCLAMANELLYDLFSNLVGNAIKHSYGDPIINIGLEKVAENDVDYYRISIEDNGPGIPDELKPVIFNRLLRSGLKAKGSGMGLYLVKTLVGDYRGRVWVEDSIPGDRSKGSRFVVMLPAYAG